MEAAAIQGIEKQKIRAERLGGLGIICGGSSRFHTTVTACRRDDVCTGIRVLTLYHHFEDNHSSVGGPPPLNNKLIPRRLATG